MCSIRSVVAENRLDGHSDAPAAGGWVLAWQSLPAQRYWGCAPSK